MRLLVPLLLLVIVSPASAASVSSTFEEDEYDTPHSYGTETQAVLSYRAGKRETNRVTLRSVGRSRIRVVDLGARLRAGQGCRSLGRHAAVCRMPRSDYEFVRARLGDGSDTFDSRHVGREVSAAGGPGADRLVGGESFNTFSGGPGDDLLVGAGYDDELTGGPGADRIDGGGRRDEIAGGPGADRLHGGPGKDEMRGEGGADHVNGGPGDDTLDDGAGPDDVRGQAGDDVLFSDDGPKAANDRYDGGGGHDRVVFRGSDPIIAGLRVGGRPREADHLHNVEGLGSGSERSRITGDDRANSVGAAGGVVYARAGNDTVDAFSRADIHCGPGRDVASTYIGATITSLLERDCEEIRDLSGYGAAAQPIAADDNGLTLSLTCDNYQRQLRLVTPRGPVSWYPAGPYGVTVATGQAPKVDQKKRCKVRMTYASPGPAHDTPAVLLGYLDRWAFRLP